MTMNEGYAEVTAVPREQVRGEGSLPDRLEGHTQLLFTELRLQLAHAEVCRDRARAEVERLRAEVVGLRAALANREAE